MVKGVQKMGKNGSLRDRVAIVTGSRRGIGKAIALEFAEAGAHIAVCALTGDSRLEAVAEEIRRLGGRALALRVDVARKADVDQLVQRVLEEFGRIDILVNNAGLWITGQTLLEVGEDDWDRVIDANLKSAYLCCHAVGKRMVDQKSGNIINVASRAGVNPIPSAGAYCSAKAGMIMFTRQLALELAPYNIRVNVIAPGWVKTDINVHLRSTPDAEKKISRLIPRGRMGEAEEISKVALFLASDDSSYVSGEMIIVDGGGRLIAPPE
jgi:NAD(P)-dependent dehydrogenase (short-subunit alcohol dehydrogenase family)